MGYDIDLRGLIDETADLGVPGGRQLIDLVNAYTSHGARDAARTAVLTHLGEESLVDTAAVLGNFEMMNRIAEGTGIPVPPQAIEREAEMMRTLGLYDILKSQQL